MGRPVMIILSIVFGMALLSLLYMAFSGPIHAMGSTIMTKSGNILRNIKVTNTRPTNPYAKYGIPSHIPQDKNYVPVQITDPINGMTYRTNINGKANGFTNLDPIISTYDIRGCVGGAWLATAWPDYYGKGGTVSQPLKFYGILQGGSDVRKEIVKQGQKPTVSYVHLNSQWTPTNDNYINGYHFSKTVWCTFNYRTGKFEPNKNSQKPNSGHPYLQEELVYYNKN